MRESKKEIIESWLHRPDPLEISGGIWPLVIGKSKAKPGYRVGPRTILHYSLHLMLEGKLHFRTGNVERTLHRGDLFCLFPEMLHQYAIAAPNKPLRLTWLAFNGSQAELLLHKVGISAENPVMEKGATEEIVLMYQQFAGIMSDQANDNSMKICSMMYELFHLLYSQSQRQPASSPEDWVRKGVDFMNLQYSQGIHVQDVARSLGVDRSHFTKKFTEHMGIGPKEYLQNLRMKKGAAMLTETSLSVTEIALSLGYPDLYAFTRAFTSFHNESPLHFRKKRQ